VPRVSLNFLPWAAFKPVKRIKLEFALGVETEFVDRDRALAQVVEWAERGTRFPVVIFSGRRPPCLGSWATTLFTSMPHICTS
jgi:hypothetical protein